MRVLLDACIDWRLCRDVVGHEVKTAHQMGWATITNGELLTLAAREFVSRLREQRPSVKWQSHWPY